MRLIVMFVALASCDARQPVTFADVEITLPADPAEMIPGPGMEVVRDNCTPCHSISTMYQQPKLSREKWAAQVEKMIAIYKAPVARADIPTIVDYFVTVSRRNYDGLSYRDARARGASVREATAIGTQWAD